MLFFFAVGLLLCQFHFESTGHDHFDKHDAALNSISVAAYELTEINTHRDIDDDCEQEVLLSQLISNNSVPVLILFISLGLWLIAEIRIKSKYSSTVNGVLITSSFPPIYLREEAFLE